MEELFRLFRIYWDWNGIEKNPYSQGVTKTFNIWIAQKWDIIPNIFQMLATTVRACVYVYVKKFFMLREILIEYIIYNTCSIFLRMDLKAKHGIERIKSHWTLNKNKYKRKSEMFSNMLDCLLQHLSTFFLSDLLHGEFHLCVFSPKYSK